VQQVGEEPTPKKQRLCKTSIEQQGERIPFINDKLFPLLEILTTLMQQTNAQQVRSSSQLNKGVLPQQFALFVALLRAASHAMEASEPKC
jgi:hypothetical protein